MKFIRKQMDKLHPLFDKGGKLEKLYPLYEAIDTFLYTPGDVSRGASHVRDGMDLKRMMIMVVVALTPCIFMACWNTGYQANAEMQSMAEAGRIAAEDVQAIGWRASVIDLLGIGYNPSNPLSCFLHGLLYFLPVFLVTNIVGGTCEVIFCVIRKHELNEGFLVTGMLFPLTLPATIPLWQVAIGIAFGVVIGKEIFGGTGKNFLNPALTSRAFLYFAYPGQISGNTVWRAAGVDGYSGATLLTSTSSAKGETFPDLVARLDTNWWDCFLGVMPGSMGETSTLACILGAILLIATGVGSWRIMAGVLAGSMGLAALLHYGLGSDTNAMFGIGPEWHLVIGGLAFGLVFMATDPVSAAMTEAGKWIYGVLIGVVAIIIRVLNPAFPEGIMLAILLGNVFAPTIDFFVVQQNIKRRLMRSES